MTADFPRAAAAHANHRGRAYPNCPYCHGHKDGAGSFPVPAMEAAMHRLAVKLTAVVQ